MPLLDITQMIAFLDEYDNSDLAFRMRALLSPSTNKQETWHFDADVLCEVLWTGVKTILEKQN